MRERPWLEPRSCPTRNCSRSVTSCPERASARAAAEPMTPAPTTATRTPPLSRSAKRDRDLHVQLLTGVVEIDPPRRAVDVSALLLGPAIDRLVSAEDLGEVALAAADLREGHFPRRESLVTARLGHADLDRAVLLVIDGTVIEHERPAVHRVAQLVEAVANEGLELGHADAFGTADVGLLLDSLGEDVVHGLLLQDTFDVAEKPPPFGELVGDLTFVFVQPFDRRVAEE